MMNAVTLLLVSLPALTFAWAYGGMRGDVLRLVMPVATICCLLGLFVLPQRHHGEGWLTACGRTWKGLLRDPLFYAILAFTTYLVIPLFNVGLSPEYDAEAIAAGANPRPPWRWLPFCVNAFEHSGMLCWFVPTLFCGLAVRHALTHASKRVFFEILVWNAAALALFGFIQILGEARFPFWENVPRKIHFFSTFGYPNMAGAFFTVGYALALGLWVFRMLEVEGIPLLEKWGEKSSIRHVFLHAHYPILAAVLNLAAVLATLCRAAMLLSLLLTGFFALYIVWRMFGTTGVNRKRKLRSAVTAGLTLIAFILVSYLYAPPEVGRELKTLNLFVLTERVSGKAQYHTRVASAIMRDHPLFGVGGWGYRHFCRSYMTPEEIKQYQTVGGANVHNDYLQFLAELGVVGFGLLVLCACLLAAPAGGRWRALAQAAISADWGHFGNSSKILFVVQPPVLWGTLGCAAVLVHAFGDCPFRSAAVLSLVLTLLPSLSGFLPRMQVKRED